MSKLKSSQALPPTRFATLGCSAGAVWSLNLPAFSLYLSGGGASQCDLRCRSAAVARLPSAGASDRSMSGVHAPRASARLLIPGARAAGIALAS